MKLSIANNTNQYQNEDIYFGIIGEQSDKWAWDMLLLAIARYDKQLIELFHHST